MEQTYNNLTIDQIKELIGELGLSIRIDGPSGSGKSTVSRSVARALEMDTWIREPCTAP